MTAPLGGARRPRRRRRRRGSTAPRRCPRIGPAAAPRPRRRPGRARPAARGVPVADGSAVAGLVEVARAARSRPGRHGPGDARSPSAARSRRSERRGQVARRPGRRLGPARRTLERDRPDSPGERRQAPRSGRPTSSRIGMRGTIPKPGVQGVRDRLGGCRCRSRGVACRPVAAGSDAGDRRRRPRPRCLVARAGRTAWPGTRRCSRLSAETNATTRTSRARPDRRASARRRRRRRPPTATRKPLRVGRPEVPEQRQQRSGRRPASAAGRRASRSRRGRRARLRAGRQVGGARPAGARTAGPAPGAVVTGGRAVTPARSRRRPAPRSPRARARPA